MSHKIHVHSYQCFPTEFISGLSTQLFIPAWLLSCSNPAPVLSYSYWPPVLSCSYPAPVLSSSGASCYFFYSIFWGQKFLLSWWRWTCSYNDYFNRYYNSYYICLLNILCQMSAKRFSKGWWGNLKTSCVFYDRASSGGESTTTVCGVSYQLYTWCNATEVAQ